MKLMKCLVLTIMTYGADGRTLRKRDQKKKDSAEMWFYGRLLRVVCKEKRTDENILTELKVKRPLLDIIKKAKLSSSDTSVDANGH